MYMAYTKIEKLINIESDQELLQFAKKYHWKGDGTKENPIRITKYAIKLQSDPQHSWYFIDMLNTTLYVIIEDCVAINAQIYLSNCQHIFILNNYLHYAEFPAIVLSECKHCVIMNNIIISSKCIDMSINGENHRIINNTCMVLPIRDSDTGIRCWYTLNHNIMANNYILLQLTKPKIFRGIHLTTNIPQQLGNAIMNNVIASTTPSLEMQQEELFVYGIETGDFNAILNNKIINVPYAFKLEDTSDIVAYNITYPIKSDRRMEYGLPKANFRYVYNVNANL